MKTKKILFILTSILFPAMLSASDLPSQQISGYVKDTTSAGVPYAVVGLASHADSSVLKFEITDERGFFEFDAVAAGHYFLKVSSVGFREFVSPPFHLSVSAGHIMDEIILTALHNSLEELTVSARKPIIESLPDRLIFHVDQLLSAGGGNAFDLLTQSPGVNINSDGLVSIRGKQNVLVLVDNRENFVQRENLVTFLKGFPAEQIQSLEIITRPSARYAASGTGGVINIKTKKFAQRGFGVNASTGVRQGILFNTNNHLALNWRNEKFYLFANYGYVINSPYNKLEMDNTFLNEAGNRISRTFQIYEVKLRNHTNSIQTGADFTHKKTFLGISYSGNFEDNLPRLQHTHTDIFDAFNQHIGTVLGERHRDNYISRNSVNFNFVQSFNRPGSELAVAADFFNYNLDFNYRISNTFSQEDSTVSFAQKTPNDIRVYSLKADYTVPVLENTRIQTGIRSSFTKMDNAYNFSLFEPVTRQYIFDPGRSMHYTFDEDIHSAYANLLHPFSETLDIEAGLRLENTVNRSVQKSTSDVLHKKYTRLFPNVLINYNPGENHSYSFSYSRRFNRPEYITLIPAYLYTDLLYYNYGNPRQDPEVADNLDLSYTLFEKFTFNFNYSFLDKTFFMANIPDPENHALGETYMNRGSKKSVALSADYADQPARWYTLMLSTTWGHAKFEDDARNEYSGQGYFGSVQMVNRFSLGKGWNAELSGVYNTGQQESAVYYLNSYGMLVAGIGKSLFKGKGGIKIQFRDPFYTQVFDYRGMFKDLSQKWFLREDTRQVGITLNYGFSSGNNAKARSRTTSNEEEKERFKQ